MDPRLDLTEASATSSIDRAVAFLRQHQLPHGEFSTLLASERKMSNPVFDSSPFVTSFVVYALSHLEPSRVDDMTKKALGFLRDEMALGGVWRYWSSRQHKHDRLPPDLDDTACISCAFRIMGCHVPNNRWAFRYARDPSGRFLTWLLRRKRGPFSPWSWFALCVGSFQARRSARRIVLDGPDDPRFLTVPIVRDDIDAVVNANVVLYLGEIPETKQAIRYIVDTVQNRMADFFSIYYEDPLTLYYTVARAHRHASPQLAILRDAIVGGVMARIGPDANFDSPLCAAKVASALQTYAACPKVVAKAIDYMIGTQRSDGGWNAYPFYGSETRGAAVWGSEELTTAFCIEALARYLPKVEQRQK
jgi:hypothetical protein